MSTDQQCIDQIAQVLEGAQFPAKKSELIAKARENGCSDPLVEELKALPDTPAFTSINGVADCIMRNRE